MVPRLSNPDIEILVAENNSAQAEQLRLLLKNDNYLVNVAGDGENALELIHRRKPAIVIADVSMPDMSGYELCRRIKSNQNLKDISVILLTELIDPIDVLNGLECGADNFLLKPYVADCLLARVSYVLTNMEPRKHSHAQLGLDIYYAGEKRLITSDRVQIMDFFLSSFEAAVRQNEELLLAKEETRKIKEELEQSVQERTLKLNQEIANRTAVESVLQESEEQFRNLVESSRDLVQSVSTDGEFVFVNPSWRQTLGYSEDEVAQLSHFDIIHPDYLAHCAELFERVQDGEHFLNVEVVFIAKNGSPINVEGNISGKFVDGECVATHAFFRDVTERKVAETELQRLFEAEKKARLIADTLRAANIALTETLEIDQILSILLEYVNRIVPFDSANVMLLGEDDELRVVMTRGYDGLTNSSKTNEISFDGRTNLILREILETKKSVLIKDTNLETNWEIVEGAEHVRSWFGVPFVTGGKVIGLYSLDSVETDFFTNEHLLAAEAIAAQATIALTNAELFEQVNQNSRMLEQRVKNRTLDLEAALERAESADRSKSTFLAMMSHELRTPLNSIIGFTGIILQGITGPLNDEQRKQLGMVQKSSRHLLNLINDVLDISKIEANQMVIKNREFDIRALIEKTIESCKPLAEAKSLTLNLSIDEHGDSIFSDERRVEQILLNLLANAIKFTSEGPINVKVLAENNYIVISIEDFGVGIRAEDQERLFEPFQQAANSVGKLNDGVGLGLAISRRLAIKLGGEISVMSELGTGSVFSLKLPQNFHQNG